MSQIRFLVAQNSLFSLPPPLTLKKFNNNNSNNNNNNFLGGQG